LHTVCHTLEVLSGNSTSHPWVSPRLSPEPLRLPTVPHTAVTPTVDRTGERAGYTRKEGGGIYQDIPPPTIPREAYLSSSHHTQGGIRASLTVLGGIRASLTVLGGIRRGLHTLGGIRRGLHTLGGIAGYTTVLGGIAGNTTVLGGMDGRHVHRVAWMGGMCTV